jgi:hypothetical protein
MEGQASGPHCAGAVAAQSQRSRSAVAAPSSVADLVEVGLQALQAPAHGHACHERFVERSWSSQNVQPARSPTPNSTAAKSRCGAVN